MYMQLFNKPKMKDKYLIKPRFRFIHDIFTSTLAVTGFGKGLFKEDELNPFGF